MGSNAPAAVPTPRTTAPQVATTTMAQPKEPEIAMPTAYDGNRKNYETFIHECLMVIDGKPGIYNDFKKKVNFVLSYMKKGNAVQWAIRNRSTINGWDGVTAGQDWAAFLDLLKAAFEEVNKGSSARTKLKALKQGRHSVDAYIGTFNEFASTTGFNDEALMEYFKAGLSRAMRIEVARSTQTFNLLKELQDYVARIDAAWRDAQQEVNPRNIYPNESYDRSYEHRAQEADPYAMDVDKTRVKQGNRNFRRKTDQEKARAREKGLCYICDKPGHMAYQCPSNRRNNSSRHFARNTQFNHDEDKSEGSSTRSQEPPSIDQLLQYAKNLSDEDFGQLQMGLKDFQ